MSGLPGKGAPTVVRTETPLKLSVAEHRNPLRLVVIPSVILRKASEQHKNEMHKSNWCKIPKTGNTKISTVLLWNPPFWKPLLTPISTIPPLLACPLRLLIPRASGTCADPLSAAKRRPAPPSPGRSASTEASNSGSFSTSLTPFFRELLLLSGCH